MYKVVYPHDTSNCERHHCISNAVVKGASNKYGKNLRFSPKQKILNYNYLLTLSNIDFKDVNGY